MVGHCAVRHWAMGERGAGRSAGDRRRHRGDDRARRRSDRAGALGFSTSRTMLHRVPDGRAVPGTYADARGAARDRRGARTARPRHVRGRAQARRARRRPTTRRPRRGGLDGGGQPAGPAGPVTVRPRPDDFRPRAPPACSSSSTTRAPAARSSARRRPRGASGCCSVSHRTFYDGSRRGRKLQALDLEGRLAALDDPSHGPSSSPTPTSGRPASTPAGVPGRDDERRALRPTRRRTACGRTPRGAASAPATFVRLTHESAGGRCSASRS